MNKITNIPNFASANKVRKYILSPGLALERYGSSDARSMGQAFARIQTALAGYGGVGEKTPIRTTRAARRFLEKIVEGDCCIIAEDEDGLNVELNCRSVPLSNLLSRDGLISIGRSIFKVDRDSITLIDGAKKTNSATAALFREFGYSRITETSNKQTSSSPVIVWQLYECTSTFRYRVKFTVTQYADQYGSVCRVEVKPQLRHWIGFIPIWTSTAVFAISIGGAFSGPQSPGLYKLPNPFNHVADYGVSSMFRDHWYDSNPYYQVDTCTYDCSVYLYDGPRIDAAVGK